MGKCRKNAVDLESVHWKTDDGGSETHGRLQGTSGRDFSVLPVLAHPVKLKVERLPAEVVGCQPWGTHIDDVLGEGGEDVHGRDVEDLGRAVVTVSGGR